MTEGTKLTGEKRRDMLLHWLKEAGSPLTGGELAKKGKCLKTGDRAGHIAFESKKSSRLSRRAKATYTSA